MIIYEVIDISSPPILVGVSQVMFIEEQLRTEIARFNGLLGIPTYSVHIT